MKGLDDDLIRLGLALYEETKASGTRMYSVHDLVYDEHTSVARQLVHRLTGSTGDFWKTAEELALGLSRAGIATHSMKPIGSQYRQDYFVQLTPFGRKLFDLAHAPATTAADIEGLRMQDALLMLRDEETAEAIASGLAGVGAKIDTLELTNFQKSSAKSYVNIMIEVAAMPEPDVSIFWLALERASYIAGVAGLVVALFQLRASN